jgi:hypothetical protein
MLGTEARRDLTSLNGITEKSPQASRTRAGRGVQPLVHFNIQDVSEDVSNLGFP